MPVEAIMLVRVKDKVDDTFLEEMRREYRTRFDRDDDDFHPEGTSVRLNKEDELIPMKNSTSTWLSMNVALRYFGESCQKGNFEFFDICAEWIESKFGDCEIWYGSDENYATKTRFNPERRKKLLEEYRRLNPEDIYTQRLRNPRHEQK